MKKIKKYENFFTSISNFFSIMCPECEKNGIKTQMKSTSYGTYPNEIYYLCPKW